MLNDLNIFVATNEIEATMQFLKKADRFTAEFYRPLKK
jgi:hypothetical protein